MLLALRRAAPLWSTQAGRQAGRQTDKRTNKRTMDSAAAVAAVGKLTPPPPRPLGANLSPTCPSPPPNKEGTG